MDALIPIDYTWYTGTLPYPDSVFAYGPPKPGLKFGDFLDVPGVWTIPSDEKKNKQQQSFGRRRSRRRRKSRRKRRRKSSRKKRRRSKR